jgi:hypothetical protein
MMGGMGHSSAGPRSVILACIPTFPLDLRVLLVSALVGNVTQAQTVLAAERRGFFRQPPWVPHSSPRLHFVLCASPALPRCLKMKLCEPYSMPHALRAVGFSSCFLEGEDAHKGDWAATSFESCHQLRMKFQAPRRGMVGNHVE